ncbi:hypothetical protein ABT294_15935 [Nonomuraea sp. NPDC000554]
MDHHAISPTDRERVTWTPAAAAFGILKQATGREAVLGGLVDARDGQD